MTRPFLQRLAARDGLRAAGGFTLARVTARALAFLAVPVLTRLMLPEEYGLAAVAWTWASLLALVASINLDSSVVRASVDHHDDRWWSYLATVMAGGGGTLLLAGIVLLLLPSDLSASLFGYSRTWLLVWVLGALGIFWATTAERAFSARRRIRSYAWLLVGIGFGQLLLSVALVLGLQDRGLGRMLGLVIPHLLAGGVFFAWVLRRSRRRFDPGQYREALQFSAPLVINAAAGLLLNQLDRLMIDRMIGPAEAGLYSIGYQISDVVSVVLYGVNAAWLPWIFARLQAGDRSRIMRRSREFAWFLGLLVAVMIPAATWLLPWVVGPRFFPAIVVVAPVVAAMGVRLAGNFYLSLQMYERRTGHMAVVSLVAVIANFGLNLWVIPRWGYVGAAWTTYASFVLLIVLHAGVASRGRFGLAWVPNVLIWVLVILWGLLAWLVQDWAGSHLLSVGAGG